MGPISYLSCFVLLLLAAPSWAAPGKPGAAEPLPEGQEAEFVQNLGQWPAPVRFAAALRGGKLFAEAQGLTYVFAAPTPGRATEHQLVPTRAWAYQVQFAGASPAEVAGRQPSGVPHTYILGKDPEHWASQAPGYGRVEYTGLYPGINLAVYGNEQAQLEYTFTVQPGGQPAAIRLHYAGLSGLQLDSAGRLHLRTPLGAVTESAPVAWQLDPATGQRRPVACAFRVAGTEVSFDLGQYDPARPLIIDPVVQFATFTGAQGDNWGHTSTYDAQGNFYSASTLFNFGYPTSPGSYAPDFNGSVDVAIIKYAPRASGAAARVWATLLGGQQADAPHRLAVTAQGEVLVLGSTSSGDFPTTNGAFDRTFRGGAAINPDAISFNAGADLFVARFSANGAQLLSSTFLGGTGTDGFAARTSFGPTSTVLAPQPSSCYGFAGGLQVDAAGEVYVAATTGSANFASKAPAGPAYGGGATDAVVVRLAADLRTVRWRQLVGGTNDDAAYDLALSADGSTAYVCGGTQSANFPVTAGAYAPPATGGSDAFVLKLATSSGQRLAACRLGTASDDQALLLSLDPAGQVLVAGLSTGKIPISSQHYGLPGKCFLAQLDAGLQGVQFSTTFSDYGNSDGLPVPMALGTDNCGNLYLAMFDRTFNTPVSTGSTVVGARYFYAVRLSAGGRSLDYALRLPGDHAHSRSCFDSQGRLYLAVCGSCDGNGSFSVPAGVNTYVSQSGSRRCNDASLLADLSPATAGLAPPQLTLVCTGADPIPLGGSPAGGTWTGPGVTGSPATGYLFTATAALVGVQQLTYQPPAGAGVCASPTSLSIIVTLPTAVTFAPLGGPFCTTGLSQSIALQAQPVGGYFSGPGVHSGGSSYATLNLSELAPGTYTISYTLPGTTGRCGSASQTITVKGTSLVVNTDTTLCGEPFRAFQLRGRPVGGTWSGAGVSASGWFDPALVPAFTTGSQSGFIRVTYAYTGADGCTSSRTVGIYKTPPLGPDLLLPAPVCQLAPGVAGYAPYTLRLPRPPVPPAGTYSEYRWDFGDGSGRITNGYTDDSAHVYTQPGTYAPVLSISYGYVGTCTRTIRYAPFTIGETQHLPNIITPNGDGLNDTFVQNQFCEPPRLRVFSRWGKPVYQTEAYLSDWGGQDLAPGLYYYLLSDRTGQQPAAKGWLEIAR